MALGFGTELPFRDAPLGAEKCCGHPPLTASHGSLALESEEPRQGGFVFRKRVILEVALLAADAIRLAPDARSGAASFCDSGDVPAPKEGSLHEVSSVRR